MTDSRIVRLHSAPPARPRLEAVYDAEVAWVIRTLARLGVPPRDRDDLAHDVFVIVHRKLPEFDPSRPIRPWLFGISYRVVADHRRRAHRRYEVAEQDARDPGAELEPRADARQALDIVAAALLRLDYERRAVFMMHELDGFTVPQIAEVIDAPLNTLYSHLRRAREQFMAAARELGLESEVDRERA